MKEHISALMDDELPPEDSSHVLAALQADGQMAATWASYHMIGDALRGNPSLSPGFQQRLMERLEGEPTVLAPRHTVAVKPSYLWSAAASFAAVALVGWVVLQQHADSGQDAMAPAVVAEATSNVSAESVNSYLLAHHERAADSSIQTAYYVRPVAYSE